MPESPVSSALTPQRFMFGQSFDPDLLRAQEEKKNAPVISEQEMALAREQAYGQGFIAGKEAALQDIHMQQTDILSHIEKLFAQMGESIWKVHAEQKKAASQLAITIARKIIPAYLQKNGVDEIMAHVESCLAEMINEPRLVLRIHDQHFDFVSEKVNALSLRLGYGGKMIILADSALGPDDCRLEWADGGMERTMNITWSELERQIARHQVSAAIDDMNTHTPSP